MYVKRKRVNKVDKYISHILEGEKLYVLVKAALHRERIEELGLNEPWVSILPSAKRGKACEYNAEGKEVVRKDLEKEPFTIERPRELTDRGWNVHSWVNYIERERYPRDFIPPYEVRLQLLQKEEEEVIVSDGIENKDEKKDAIKNTINMFLELFGECYVVGEDMQIHIPEFKRLDWVVLPVGEYPWDRIKQIIGSYFPDGSLKKNLFMERVDYLLEFEPDFRACWINGFEGYFVFWYRKLGLYVAENVRYGNATYVFSQGWEDISKMTKAEIIRGELAERRIIHSEGWSEKIRALLGK